MHLPASPLRARPSVFARFVAVCAFAACALAFAAPARANNISVNGLGDALSNNGVCTLREAVINANNDAATWPDCAAGSGADVININPAGTITFAIANVPVLGDSDQLAARGDLDIISSMTINGSPGGTTINANAIDRIFDINPDTDEDPMTTAPAIVVHLNRVHITNGYQNQSGAMRVQNDSTLFVNDSTISASRAWADDGGGVFIFGGTVTMTNCTVSGNRAYLHAAGIRNEGVLNLVSCTVTNNNSDFNNLAGGIWGNTAPGGTTLRNTIVAGNGGVDCPNLLGQFTSLGYNVVGEFGTIVGNPVIVPAVGDQLDVSDASVMLGPLASNSGPTPTHGLQGGSIAIDRGHASGLTTDQRGRGRPCDQLAIPNGASSDGSDSGAFEVGTCVPNVAAPPNAVDDNVNVNEDSGANAVNVLANDTDANGDTLSVISVTQGANGGTVAITGGGTGVSYTPAPNYNGPDSFTYTISDGNGGQDTATVTVNVVNVNDAPVANNDNYSMNQDTTLTVLPASGVLANDTDIDGPTQTVVLDSGPSNAAAFGLNADGSFSYTPNPGFTGVDTFDYHVNDGAAVDGDSNVATVTINVSDTQAPVVTCSVTKALLWPPNSDLVNVGLSVTATDNDGEEPSVEIEVFSDEDDAEQPGGMSPDAKDAAAQTLRLRAERRGNADGRVYVIRIKATDTANNVSYSYCTVVVPHSQSKASLSAVNAQAASAVAAFVGNGNNPPAGFFLVGDGPTIGPKQ
jgi:CSLREA domain-containing protein